jgi:hypothetical protein
LDRAANALNENKNAHKNRNAINDDVVGAKAQPKLNPIENKLEIWSTYTNVMRNRE